MTKKRRPKRSTTRPHVHLKPLRTVRPEPAPEAAPKSAANRAPKAKTNIGATGSKSGGGGDTTRTFKVRRHNNRLSLILIAGSLLLFIWYMARRTVCWGNYGYLERHLGITLCNTHLATGVALLASLFFAFLMIVEISNLDYASFEGQPYRRARSLWSGYRSLKGWDSFHFHFGTLALIGLGWLFIWIIFFSPIRF